MSPRIPHSFVHDLESAYLVLLYTSACHINHMWSGAHIANLVYDILGGRRYKSAGGVQKNCFMMSMLGILDFEITSNKPLTSLIRNLHCKHMDRHFPFNFPMTLSEEKRAILRPPTFVDHDKYWENDFRHQVFLDIFDAALESPGWPTENDKAIQLDIPRSDSNTAREVFAPKRSRSAIEDGGSTGISERSSKWLNSTW